MRAAAGNLGEERSPPARLDAERRVGALIAWARRAAATLAIAMLATLLAACGDVGLHGPLPPDADPNDAGLYVPMFFGDNDGALGKFSVSGSTNTDPPQVFTVLSAGRTIAVIGKQPDQSFAAMLFRLVSRISSTEYLIHYAEGATGSGGTGCVLDTDPQLVRTCSSVDSAGKVTVESTPAKANFARLELLADGGIRISTLLDATQGALSAVLTDSGVSLRVDDNKSITQDLLSAEPAGRIYAALRSAAERDASSAGKSTVMLEFHATGPDAALEAAANLAAWAGQYDRAATIARTFAVTDDPAHAATLGQLSRRGLFSVRDCALEETVRRQVQPLADRIRAIMQNVKGGIGMFGSFAALPGDLAGTAASCDTQSLSISTSAAPPTGAGVPTRRALVIGMSGYTDPRLLVPGDRTKADALAVAYVLKNVAHYADAVVMPSDADNAVFDATFTSFLGTIRQGDQVLLFYSGHGIEYRGDNYLLLRDAQGSMPKDDFSIKRLLDRTATSLRDMIKALKARGPSNIIVVLNACRNITDPNLGLGDGQFDFSAPSRMPDVSGVGTLFATTSDTFAEVCLGDCNADKSPYTVFTRYFLEKLATPDLTVTNLYYEVGAAVQKDVASHLGRVQRADWHDQTEFELKGQVYIGPVLNAGIDVIPQPKPNPEPGPNSAMAAQSLEACRLAAAPPLLFERIEPASAIAACTDAVSRNAGSADAEGWLGRAYDANTDYRNAALHYRTAADGGMALAQHNLANLYRKGQGVGIDAAEAFRLYRLAADQEFPQSFASLAEYYERGEVVGKDLAEARRLYQLAANRGVARGVDGVTRVEALLAAGAASAQCEALAAPPANGKGVDLLAIDTSKAEAACRAALAENPGDADLAFYLGRVLNAAGRFPDAVALFTQAADTGHAAAQNSLGRMYVTGSGTTKDVAKAFALFEKSAAQGDPNGLVNLADCYVNGIGVTQDVARGAQLYHEALKAGSPDASFWLANLYLFGSGVPKDYAEARRLYEMARSNGIIGASIGLGMIYENGYGVPVNYAAALAQYGDGSAGGNASATTHLAQMYEKGLGVPVDLAKARALYEKAAGQGNADAKAALARLGPDTGLADLAECRRLAAPRLAGQGVEFNAIDVTAATTACEAALTALPGNSEAQYLSGRVAERAGRTADALALYEKSSAQNYAPAQTNLGVLYQNGIGVSVDLAKGIALYRAAADQGYPSALSNLGYVYRDGKGVPQDYDAAFRYFSDAARGGSNQAAFELANLHMLGHGTKVDYAAGLRNYRTAWADGFSPGAVGIGLIYDNGYGVQVDYSEAMRFYDMASKAGNAEGTYYVGRLYELGRGVSKDLAAARRLYQQAADGGNADAKAAITRLGGTSDAVDNVLKTCRDLAAPRVSGHGVHFESIDPAKAEPACRTALAVAATNPERQYLLGRVLDRMENYTEAAALYTKASDQDYAPAQSSLGVLHLYGRGVTANTATARQLFQLSAAQGDASGLSNLGLAIELGYGSPADPAAARPVYEQAVAAGSPAANLHLGSLYYEGRGVAKDLDKSAQLMNLALDDGVTVETAAWGAH